ncbi:hypothetical protein BV898_05267 [Hypsibius exemplaris]|uniref:Uncharacterized protein n=1 Tax=Hypsibius exemplaris TaxID=2072580 RepID=A0A1W0WZQ5_HYPEX|nr:hypothetical protein BV898_05267 [Hypsibius exemplaris]
MNDFLNDILETEDISEFFQSFNGKQIPSPETPLYNLGNLEVSMFVVGDKLEIGLRASRKMKSFRVSVQEFLQVLAYILTDHCEHYEPYYKDKEKMVSGYLLKPENNAEVFKINKTLQIHWINEKRKPLLRLKRKIENVETEIPMNDEYKVPELPVSGQVAFVQKKNRPVYKIGYDKYLSFFPDAENRIF